MCDVIEFSSKHVPDPSPSSSHENGFHALLITQQAVPKPTLQYNISFGHSIPQNVKILMET